MPVTESTTSYVEFITKNFGFLYTHRGRSYSVLFIGSLCFSSIDKDLDRYVLNIIAGILVSCAACFMLFSYCVHPTIGTFSLKPDLPAKQIVEQENFSGEANEYYGNDSKTMDVERGATGGLSYEKSPFGIDDTDGAGLPLHSYEVNDDPFLDSETREEGSKSINQDVVVEEKSSTTVEIKPGKSNIEDNPFAAN
eukprot:snap_masked-scaffold_38-processed-gene-2.73-mRNA-1 protein AED:1.00 eAED:1.00 QI:0/-1/0/0/-1/1/1/0/194